MAYQPIEEEAKFQTKLRRLEPTDPDHADTFNPLFETLLNNDVFLNQETDKVKEHCENNSVHVTTEQREQWSQIVTPQQDGQMTKEDKLKLDGIEKGAQENQNAFGEIRIGSTSIAANKKDTSITLKAGANIELKGDNSTKTLEIKAQNATDASEMTYQNPHQAGGNTTDLETVLNYIADKVLHKLIEKSDIIQNTQISDTTKIPSSVVTKNLQEQITQLNNNLTKNQFIDITNQCNFCYSITPIGIYGSFVKYNPYTKEIKAIIHMQENVGNQSLIMTLPSFIINTHYGMCGLGISSNNFTFAPRIVSNEIYSSHTIDTSVTQPSYLLDFIY